MKLNTIDNVREERLNGREYLVAPVVAMRAMSLDGGYVPAEHVKKATAAWNGEPVTLYHPTTPDGELTSANSPDIAEKTLMGRFYNVSYDEDTTELSGEVWIDVDRAKELGEKSAKAVEMLENGKPVPVSTAYFGDELPAGEYDGEMRDEVVGNIRPDHLALLPDGEGKCSIDDGCMAGVPAVNMLVTNNVSEIQEDTSETVTETVEDGAKQTSDDKQDNNMEEPEEYGEKAGKAFMNKLRNTLGIDMTTREDMIDVLVNEHEFTEDSLEGMGDECLKMTFESFNSDSEPEGEEVSDDGEEEQLEEMTEEEQEDSGNEVLSELQKMRDEMVTADDVQAMIAANEQQERRQKFVDEILENSDDYDREVLDETPVEVLENIRDDVTEVEPVANFAGQRGASPKPGSNESDDFPTLSVPRGEE